MVKCTNNIGFQTKTCHVYDRTFFLLKKTIISLCAYRCPPSLRKKSGRGTSVDRLNNNYPLHCTTCGRIIRYQPGPIKLSFLHGGHRSDCATKRAPNHYGQVFARNCVEFVAKLTGPDDSAMFEGKIATKAEIPRGPLKLPVLKS